MQHILLPSGKHLLYEKTNKYKGEFLSAHYMTPASRADMTPSALATALLLRGSAKYKTQQLLSKRCEELYALSVNSSSQRYGAMHTLSFATGMLSNRYSIDGTDITAETIRFLGGIIHDPFITDGGFDAGYTEREKINLRDALAAQVNSKSAYARRRTVELMCDGETAGIFADGYIDEIKDITPRSAAEHLKKTLNNSSLLITYVGSCEPDALCGHIEQYLFAADIAYPKTAPQKHTVQKYRDFSEHMDVTQSKVVVGFRSPRTLFDTDYIKYALFNELFGGGTASRLFLNVREKQSLCYYCGSRSYALDGITLVEAGVKQGDAEVLTTAVHEQLDDIKNGNVSDGEFDCAKRSLTHGYMSVLDSPSSVSSWYTSRFMADRYDSPLDAARSLDGITKGDIVEIARDLTPDCRFVLEG